MNTYEPNDLSRAVAAICPDIQCQVVGEAKLDEKTLWWELSVCILSSQVPYSLAVAAANVIDKEDLLFSGRNSTKYLFQKVYDILQVPLYVEGSQRKYRFPEVRARQLAETRRIITYNRGSLRLLVSGFLDAIEARAWLVKYIPGVGPKQASMFLRNIGISYDLAILDRHVLCYMEKIGIYSERYHYISELLKYRKYESILRKHADELECPLGLLDWAIWIVMRVANRSIEVVKV